MQLCLCVTDTIIQHFVRCIETDGLHVQYLQFLQTVVKSDGQYLRKCQDIVMQEVCILMHFCAFYNLNQYAVRLSGCYWNKTSFKAIAFYNTDFDNQVVLPVLALST